MDKLIKLIVPFGAMGIVFIEALGRKGLRWTPRFAGGGNHEFFGNGTTCFAKCHA